MTFRQKIKATLWEDKVTRYTLIIVLSILVISGTYGGTEEGFVPFVNKKVGKSFGINIGLKTELIPGSEFYGINLSLFNVNKGTINGLNLGLGNVSFVGAKVNGIEISFGNGGGGKDIHTNSAIVNGLQIGIGNGATEGNCVQLGFYNKIKKTNGENKTGFLINYIF